MLRSGSRDPRPLLISIVFGAVLVASLAVYYQPTGCTLEVWSSQEKYDLLRAIKNAYDATAGGQACPVTVDRVASGTAEQALANGWQAAGRPRPDVWAPAASTWVELLSQALWSHPGVVGLPLSSPSIAHSPLVIAMPLPMASAVGWPERQLGWADVLNLEGKPGAWAANGHPEWGTFQLGQTDPTVSTSGLHAFIGMFSAAVEVRDRSDTPVSLTKSDIADPGVISFVQGVENRVVHFTDTVASFENRLQTAGDLTYVSAVAMEEQEVWSYNSGKPRVPLAAVYPREGTLFADHPYVVLAAPWVDAAKRAAAANFLQFLLSRPQQRTFQKHGFRDGNVAYPLPDDSVINQSNGLLARQPALTLTEPAPAVLEQIEQAWPNVH
jgi:Ca-activated chloride channel family protein